MIRQNSIKCFALVTAAMQTDGKSILRISYTSSSSGSSSIVFIVIPLKHTHIMYICHFIKSNANKTGAYYSSNST